MRRAACLTRRERKFACVDGPEFDGHQVDFKELIARQKMYNREERRAMWDHQCKLEFQAKQLKKTKRRERMPEQDPKKRIQNFNEVALGYTRENAIREASRCLQCKNMPCVEGCPVNITIPAFIKKVKEGDIGYWPPGKALAIFSGPTPMSAGSDPVPAGEVNIVGRIIGDATSLKKEKDAGKIIIESA